MEFLQLKSSYILHKAVVINTYTKLEYETDLFIIEYDKTKLIYDLNNNNIQIGEYQQVKIDVNKTKYEIIIESK